MNKKKPIDRGRKKCKGAVPKNAAKGSVISVKLRKKAVNLKAFALIIILLFIFTAAIPPKEVKNHIGEPVITCGFVAATGYEPNRAGKPTFLDFTAPYPENSLTVIIWGKDRDKFSEAPEKLFLNRRVCVNGEARFYKKTPHIFVDSPLQIRFQQEEKPVSKEEKKYAELKEYHEFFYEGAEIYALKIIFRALGYEMNEMQGQWTKDIYNAVFVFQENIGVKKRNGKMTTEMLLALEKTIDESEKLGYRDKVKYFNMLQPLITRRR